jgi:hypothetical protein
MKEKYQVPKCDCGKKMVFVEKDFNENMKHNIYEITKSGYKGMVIGETDEELLEGFEYNNWTMCKKCGTKWKWKSGLNHLGKVINI